MIKVCHLTSAHNRYDVRIFQKECKSLAQNGYSVTLIVNDNEDNEVINNINIVSTKFEPKNRIDRILNSINKIYKKAIEVEADIYHFHDPELLILGNRLKKQGKKVIFDSHENYPMQIKEKYYIPKLLRNFISYSYYVYESYSVKRFDAVIFPCTISQKNPFANRAKRTVFINNVPLLDEFYNKYSENEEKLDKTVCCVGSLTYNRGLTHLIKAINKAKVNLILGGRFSPDEYFTEIKNMPEFSCVQYKGYVNRSEVAEIYKKSLIGVCTVLNVGQYSKVDNFATKVYEYMSMGLPVIISDYPYARKILETYEFGIAVDPENIDEITNSILYLCNNHEISKKMGQEGRRAVKEMFNWHMEEQKLLELYQYLTF